MRSRMTSGRRATRSSYSSPDVAEHPGREVLDHDVGALDEPQHELAALGLREVDGHRPLARVGAVERGAVLHPVGVGRRPHGGEAHAVGPAGRLDLDHVGAERRELVRARGPGPERGEVEHGHAVERQRTAPRGLDASAPSGVARRRSLDVVVGADSGAAATGRTGDADMRNGDRGATNPRGARRTRRARRSGPSTARRGRCRPAPPARGTARRARRSRRRCASPTTAAPPTRPARGCGRVRPSS